MTEMEITSAPRNTSRCFSAKRILFFLGTATCALLLAAAVSQLHDGSSPWQALRRTHLPESSNSLHQSWMSVTKQASSLLGNPIEVEEIRSPRQKVMELKDPVRMEVSSDDEEVIITVIEHKDPDLSDSGKDEFRLKFQGGGHGDIDQQDVQSALSEALRSGLRDPDEISKAVSENLNNHHKKKNIEQPIQKLDGQKDKP